MFSTKSMIVAALLAVASSLSAQTSPRERVSIDKDWRFMRGDPGGDRASLTQAALKPWILPTGNAFIADSARRFVRPNGEWNGLVAHVRPDFDDAAWERVNLPHDWAITGPFSAYGPGEMGRLPSAGVGWYRRKLVIPRADAGKSIFLDVDGAMSYASVWLNGHLVGGWPYGYTSWRVDLSPYAVPGGTNQLAIRLDNPPNSSRWYTGAGIYRHLWLTKTQPVHVAQWGTNVRTRQVSATAATVDLDVTVDNDSPNDATVRVVTNFYPLDNKGARNDAPVASFESADERVPARAHTTINGSVVVANPRLWGPPPTQRPNRYLAVTFVKQSGNVTDQYETVFGIRDVRFDSDSGIFVNGQRVPIHGVNNHHDLGALGAAFNERAAERQLEILREMGANAIRTSHNPPAPELLALTDSLGFLVLDEAFDVWLRQKTPLDYHLLFADWYEQDLRAMVRRDRNHPSVFLWSIGNEVGEQYTGAEGAVLARQLVNIVHEEDPTRPVTSAMNYAKPDMPFPAALDVIGLNYQGEGIRQDPEFIGSDRIRTSPQYPGFHERFRNEVVLSTETASAFSSRGVYLFPVTSALSAPVRDGKGGDTATHQVSAYELYAVDFGSSADKVFGSLDRHPYVAGEFVWSGFDYLGEPAPYNTSRSSYSGILDLAGLKKDRFYLYQAHWRPDLRTAHILPHWNWPERLGEITPVHVFTSGDEAELFLNGKSLGRRRRGPYDYRLRWDSVRYEPGTLEVVSYRNGTRWAADTVRTAGRAVRLEAQPDRAVIRADAGELAFVTVRVADGTGLTNPRADNLIHFAVDGPGEIVATDNGDPTSLVPFSAHDRRAFNGRCLVIVRPTHPAGQIVVTASSEGLRTATAVITVTSGEP